MSTVTLAKEVAAILNAVPTDAKLGDYGDAYVYADPYGDSVSASVYLGSYLGLDPCGRYHHILSINGATKRCEDFWESLERQLSKRSLSLTSGEGDPTDIYAERYLRDASEDNEESEETES